MRLDSPVRALTRFWVWATPGLIALEPAAMACYEAMRTSSKSPTADADVGPHLVALHIHRSSERSVSSLVGR